MKNPYMGTFQIYTVLTSDHYEEPVHGNFSSVTPAILSGTNAIGTDKPDTDTQDKIALALFRTFL